jgi:hypothetical protein
MNKPLLKTEFNSLKVIKVFGVVEEVGVGLKVQLGDRSLHFSRRYSLMAVPTVPSADHTCTVLLEIYSLLPQIRAELEINFYNFYKLF